LVNTGISFLIAGVNEKVAVNLFYFTVAPCLQRTFRNTRWKH